MSRRLKASVFVCLFFFLRQAILQCIFKRKKKSGFPGFERLLCGLFEIFNSRCAGLQVVRSLTVEVGWERVRHPSICSLSVLLLCEVYRVLLFFGNVHSEFLFPEWVVTTKKMLRSSDCYLKSMFLYQAEPVVSDPGQKGTISVKSHFLFCNCIN